MTRATLVLQRRAVSFDMELSLGIAQRGFQTQMDKTHGLSPLPPVTHLVLSVTLKAWSQRTQQHLKVIPRECFQPEGLPDVSQADVGRAPESFSCQHRPVSGSVLAPIECGFCGRCWEIYHTSSNQDLTWQRCWVLWKCWWAGCLAGRKGASVACNMCNRYQTHGYRLAGQIMPSFLFLNLQNVWLEQPWLLPVYENCWIPLLCFFLVLHRIA